jgi:hypothetical protein
LHVSHRPLVLVFGLTVGDYLLWNWSLNSNRDLLALVSGLTLPPLAVVFLWLLALSIARLLARTARRPARRSGRGRTGEARDRQHRPATTATPAEGTPASAASTGAPSRKIAA